MPDGPIQYPAKLNNTEETRYSCNWLMVGEKPNSLSYWGTLGKKILCDGRGKFSSHLKVFWSKSKTPFSSPNTHFTVNQHRFSQELH